jgi:enoyl-CoA hydratase/carnithine racemase
MSNLPSITLERDNNIAILTLSNPGRRNAFTQDMRRDLTAKFNQLQSDQNVKAIILTGAEGHFCSGGDISAFGKATQIGMLEQREWYRETSTMLRAMADGVKPTIAAVEGDCVGAGFSMALLCDFVVAAKNARLGAAFAKLGLLPDTGVLYTLQKRVGMQKMRKMLMLAQLVGGEEGEKIGLVDDLAEPGQALAVAKQLADGFNDVAPMVVSSIRISLRNGINSLDDALRAELDLQGYMCASEDLKEGIKAFMEKRKPHFTGL